VIEKEALLPTKRIFCN